MWCFLLVVTVLVVVKGTACLSFFPEMLEIAWLPSLLSLVVPMRPADSMLRSFPVLPRTSCELKMMPRTSCEPKMCEPPCRSSQPRPRLTDAPRPRFDADMFNQFANPPTFEGTSLSIVEFPSCILREATKDVTKFDGQLAQLCTEFFSVMYGANGVGLAAPQVGLSQRLFVYNIDPTAPGALRKLGERVVINPKILEYSGATDVEVEGCLSSRSECCIGDICRAKSLRVEYQDERGRVKQKKLRGFEARVFQHEYDHLEGVLHIDRQSEADRAKNQPYLEKLIEQHGPGGMLEPLPDAAERMQPPLQPAMPADPPLPESPEEASAKGKASKPRGGSSSSSRAVAKAAGLGGGAGFGGGSSSSSSSSGKRGKSKKKR